MNDDDPKKILTLPGSPLSAAAAALTTARLSQEQALARSLRPDERQALIIAGKDPDIHVALDLPVRQIRPVGLNRGALVMQAEILVPASLFAGFDKPKVIVRADGRPDVPDLVLGTVPLVRLVIPQSAIGEQAKAEMTQSLRFQDGLGPPKEVES